MKMLTDIFGYDGNDKKKRHVKKIIERMFLDKLSFIKILSEPQVSVKAGAQDRGEMLHRKNKTEDRIQKDVEYMFKTKCLHEKVYDAMDCHQYTGVNKKPA